MQKKKKKTNCNLLSDDESGLHESISIKLKTATFKKEIEMCSSRTYCFGKDTHELRELMCEHGQHGSERAKACCEEDEEGQLFFWVHRHLVERWSNGQKNRGSH